MKVKGKMSIAIAAIMVMGCMCLTAFAAAESSIDQDDAELVDVGTLKTEETADWGKLVDTALYSNRVAYYDVADIQVAENVEWATLLDEEAEGVVAADETMPLARGNLAPEKAYIFNSMSLTKGEIITLDATWTPSSAGVSIGLINNATGVGIMKPVTGGSGTAAFEVTQTGNFSLVIANTSSVSVNWDMSYIIK